MIEMSDFRLNDLEWMDNVNGNEWILSIIWTRQNRKVSSIQRKRIKNFIFQEIQNESSEGKCETLHSWSVIKYQITGGISYYLYCIEERKTIHFSQAIGPARQETQRNKFKVCSNSI